jgi:dienelactone hydrolase
MAVATFRNDRALFRRRLLEALDVLQEQALVDESRTAAIGYCFGGTAVLELARSGAELNGVVSFHGGLDSPNPADGAKIKARVLALHGADDPLVSAEDLTAFEKELRQHKIDWQLIKYGGAVHSFTDRSAGNDNSRGIAYNATADQRSFEAFKQFARESLLAAKDAKP